MQQEGRYLKAEESLLASGPDTPGGSEGQQVSGSRPFRRVGKQARKMWEFSSSAPTKVGEVYNFPPVL